jgi:hypothetical protein
MFGVSLIPGKATNVLIAPRTIDCFASCQFTALTNLFTSGRSSAEVFDSAHPKLLNMGS